MAINHLYSYKLYNSGKIRTGQLLLGLFSLIVANLFNELNYFILIETKLFESSKILVEYSTKYVPSLQVCNSCSKRAVEHG